MTPKVPYKFLTIQTYRLTFHSDDALPTHPVHAAHMISVFPSINSKCQFYVFLMLLSPDLSHGWLNTAIGIIYG